MGRQPRIPIPETDLDDEDTAWTTEEAIAAYNRLAIAHRQLWEDYTRLHQDWATISTKYSKLLMDRRKS